MVYGSVFALLRQFVFFSFLIFFFFWFLLFFFFFVLRLVLFSFKIFNLQTKDITYFLVI